MNYHAVNLLGRFKRAKEVRHQPDPDLTRLLAAAEAGRSGVNLADLSDEEMLKILSRQSA